MGNVSASPAVIRQPRDIEITPGPERDRYIWAAVQAGFTYRTIGAELHLDSGRISVIIKRLRRAGALLSPPDDPIVNHSRARKPSHPASVKDNRKCVQSDTSTSKVSPHQVAPVVSSADQISDRDYLSQLRAVRARLAAALLDEDKIGRASLRDVAVALGIADDHIRAYVDRAQAAFRGSIEEILIVAARRYLPGCPSDGQSDGMGGAPAGGVVDVSPGRGGELPGGGAVGPA